MIIQKNKISSAVMEFPFENIVPITKHLNLPIAWEDVLDETHGTAKIVLTEMLFDEFAINYGIRVDKPFNANMPIEIFFEGQKTSIRMIVARDTAEMIRKDGFETWSHTVELVDEAKLLEQEPVDNLTFKNPLPRIYDENADIEWTMVEL